MNTSTKNTDIRKRTEVSPDTTRLLQTTERFNEKSSRNYGVLTKSELQQSLLKSRLDLSIKADVKQKDHLKRSLLTQYRQEPNRATIRLKESSYNLLNQSCQMEVVGKVAEESKHAVKPLLNVNAIILGSDKEIDGSPAIANSKEVSRLKSEKSKKLASLIELHISDSVRNSAETATKQVNVVFHKTPAKSTSKGWRSTASSREPALTRSLIKTQTSFLLSKKSATPFQNLQSASPSPRHQHRSFATTSYMSSTACLAIADEVKATGNEDTGSGIKEKEEEVGKGSGEAGIGKGKERAAQMAWEKYKASKGLSAYIMVEEGKILEEGQYLTFRYKNEQRWGDVVDLVRACTEYFKSYNREKFRLSCFEMEQLLDQSTFYPGFPTENQLKSLMSADLIFSIEGVGAEIDKKKSKLKSKERLYSYERSVFIIQRALRRLLSRRLHQKLESTKRLIGYIGQKMLVKAKYAQTKRVVRGIQQEYQEKYAKMCYKFELLWPDLLGQKRVEIHFNSLGYHKDVRAGVENFQVHQNADLRVLSRLKDNKVSIILVTFDGLPQETVLYHIKLFEILGLSQVMKRFKIVKLVNLRLSSLVLTSIEDQT